MVFVKPRVGIGKTHGMPLDSHAWGTNCGFTGLVGVVSQGIVYTSRG